MVHLVEEWVTTDTKKYFLFLNAATCGFYTRSIKSERSIRTVPKNWVQLEFNQILTDRMVGRYWSNVIFLGDEFAIVIFMYYLV